MPGLALRPGFRLKARSPSIEPPGAGDDTSLGKQSSELQGQLSSAGSSLLRVSHPTVRAPFGHVLGCGSAVLGPDEDRGAISERFNGPLSGGFDPQQPDERRLVLLLKRHHGEDAQPFTAGAVNLLPA